jgi:hypothetical protein
MGWDDEVARERQRKEQALKEFLAFVEVLDWPAEAAQVYGEIRAALGEKGRHIGGMDLLIAAHAIHERAPLATRNRNEFERVKGLRMKRGTGRDDPEIRTRDSPVSRRRSVKGVPRIGSSDAKAFHRVGACPGRESNPN